jgi:hypothetical protein
MVTDRYHAMRQHRRDCDGGAYCAELLEMGEACLDLAGAAARDLCAQGCPRERGTSGAEL